MLTTRVQKTALLGPAFLMTTGAAILFMADGKNFLNQPIGAAFFTLWNIWWVVVFSLRSQSISRAGLTMKIPAGVLFGGIFLAVCLGAPWEYLHFSAPLPRNGFSAWLGVGLMALAVVLVTATLWAMDHYCAKSAASSAGCYLVSRGPFRYVRHPGYFSLTLFLVGIALCLSSLIAWIAVGASILTCLLQISNDEKQLAWTYVKAYEAYRKQTHWAYLPGVF